MDATEAPRRADLRVSEKDFMQNVIDIARLNGWSTYHTHSSLHSAAGFPDIVLTRGERLIFAELKTENGRLSPAQGQWLGQLRLIAQANSTIEVYLWKPSDWQHVTDVLARGGAR